MLGGCSGSLSLPLSRLLETKKERERREALEKYNAEQKAEQERYRWLQTPEGREHAQKQYDAAMRAQEEEQRRDAKVREEHEARLRAEQEAFRRRMDEKMARERQEKEAQRVAEIEAAIKESGETPESIAKRLKNLNEMRRIAAPEPLREHIPKMRAAIFRSFRDSVQYSVYVRLDPRTEIENAVGLLLALNTGILVSESDGPYFAHEVVILHADGLIAFRGEGLKWLKSEMEDNPRRELEVVDQGFQRYGMDLRMSGLPKDARQWLR